MPDEPRKPLAKLHSSVPENVREFVRCRSDSLDIAPQALDIPGLPGVTLSFDDGDNGSVTIRLDAPGDFLDADIPVSIEDGHLVADTSSLSMGRGHVDQWIKDFNADLDAPPAKQLSGVSIRNGKLHATKSPVISETETPRTAIQEPPMVPAAPPAHVVDPIPKPIESPPPMAIPPPPAHITNPIPGRGPTPTGDPTPSDRARWTRPGGIPSNGDYPLDEDEYPAEGADYPIRVGAGGSSVGETVGPFATWRAKVSTRQWLIGGGVVVIVTVVTFFAMSGGGDPPPSSGANQPPAETSAAVEPPAVTADETPTEVSTDPALDEPQTELPPATRETEQPPDEVNTAGGHPGSGSVVVLPPPVSGQDPRAPTLPVSRCTQPRGTHKVSS